jgi:hypothetical protein
MTAKTQTEAGDAHDLTPFRVTDHRFALADPFIAQAAALLVAPFGKVGDRAASK